MTHGNWLQTLAEIGLGFAGFSALIAGLMGLGFSLACLIGRPESSVPTYYLTALVGILGISAVNFAGFVFAMNDEPAEDRG